MKTRVVWIVALVAAVATTTDAFAQTYARGYDSCAVDAGQGYGYGYGHGTFGDTYKQAYMQNLIWPKQYVQPARAGICQAFETMVSNGWRRQNLLGKYHFEEDGSELTNSGRLKAQWVLTQAPPHRRTVFVERGQEDGVTTNRIASVQDYASTLGPTVSPADVRETHILDEGHPAEPVNAMFVRIRQGTSPPVPSILPQTNALSADGD